MRQPKTFLLLSVVVTVLFMAVAYAAISNVTLQISGNVEATPDQANFDVELGYETFYGDGTANVKINSKTSATMNVTGLTAVGDSVDVYFTIKNNSKDISANISSSVTNSNTQYFSVSTESVETINPGQSQTFKVTVTLKKIPITSTQTASITINIVASPSETYY